MQANSFLSLEQVIDLQPLKVVPQTSLNDVIRQMQEWGNSCYFTENDDNTATSVTTPINNSCALIVEEERLQGIFTERDLVRLIATGRYLADIAIGEVMSQNMVALIATGSEDVFTALNMLRQHRIRHLPVVDDCNNLLGLITAKNLRQKLSPINLIKWRKVSEVMETEVIYANPDDSVRYTAQLMANHQISCVAIAETQLEEESNRSLVYPIGIITERDIVQFQNLNLDLEQPTRNLMSAPLFLVSPEDTLWSVHQQMQQRHIRRLLVGDARGELRGIITQTSLFQVFDPAEMYELIEVLQQQVSQLERERTQLLEMREQEELFRVLLTSAPVGIFQTDAQGDCLFVNPRWQEIAGLSFTESLGQGWISALHPDDRDLIYSEWYDAAQTGREFSLEYRFRTPQGKVIWVSGKAVPRYNEVGAVTGYLGTLTDISKRKRREEILTDLASGVTAQVGENFFPSLVQYLTQTLDVDYAFVGILIAPKQERVKTLAFYDTSRGDTCLGNCEYDLTGTPCENIADKQLCIYPETVRQMFPADQFLQDIEAEGYAGMVIFDSAGQALGLIAIIDSKPLQNISLITEVLKIFATRATVELERQQSEEKIHEQAALLDLAYDAIMIRGLDDQVIFWNQGAVRLYGWTKEEAVNKQANELFYRKSQATKAKLDDIHQQIGKKGEWQGEFNQVTKAGENIVVQSRWTLVKDEAGNPQSYLVVNTNITEQKQLEAQFLRTQRLESLGTLAGGIAHDLNNILAPILGFARLLPLKIPDLDEQTKGFFQIMETNAQRGAALVKQILTFAQGQEGERGTIQIRHLIAEIKQIIAETFPKTIELEISAPKNLWTVNGDVNQLHQILMNLIVNARDAMLDGGKLIIKAENFRVDADYARLHLDASEGSYLLITVADTGMGIPPEIIDRIFEPFFTTKEIGRGTGLGLSTVIGIVKSHGGFVDVASDIREETRGTQVKVFLPASEAVVTAIEETEEIPQGNGELILVVDDETSILEVTKATLEACNYKVLTANNGIDAIAIYTRDQDIIDLVLIDMIMPSMSGQTLIRTLKKIAPETKVIAVSGLVSSRELIAELDNSIIAFINKPYVNDELLKTIHQIVSG